MTQHTPAPWKWVRANKHFSDNAARERMQANARLIAAAPDLLDALIELDQQCQAGEAYQQGTFETVQAAIRKAKGE